MRREYIRATPSWRKGRARYDCVFVNARPELGGMRGLEVAWVFLFFLFVHGDTGYPCALVQWFLVIGNEPDDETGFWMVEPDVDKPGFDSRHAAARNLLIFAFLSFHLSAISLFRIISPFLH